ncbi:MAG: hypothetical protein K9K37_07920 [Desulfocapsa sp.]|nr:hypothetical protein [Desulfocapsa sp.]
MKLFIHLSNNTKDEETIKHSLRRCDCSVNIEGGDIIIVTSSLVTGYPNLSETSILLKTCSKVRSFLGSINGAAKLKNLSFPELTLKKISFENPDKKKIDIPNPVEIHCCFVLGNGQPPDISKIVELSSQNDAVSKALRLYNQELDWDNLSRVYDVIEETGFSFPGITKKTKNAFGGSANRSTISGDSARHGYIKPKGDEPKLIMSLHEARHFMRQVLSNWLESLLQR